jgi:hypothetical protein
VLTRKRALADMSTTISIIAKLRLHALPFLPTVAAALQRSISNTATTISIPSRRKEVDLEHCITQAKKW